MVSVPEGPNSRLDAQIQMLGLTSDEFSPKTGTEPETAEDVEEKSVAAQVADIQNALRQQALGRIDLLDDPSQAEPDPDQTNLSQPLQDGGDAENAVENTPAAEPKIPTKGEFLAECKRVFAKSKPGSRLQRLVDSFANNEDTETTSAQGNSAAELIQTETEAATEGAAEEESATAQIADIQATLEERALRDIDLLDEPSQAETETEPETEPETAEALEGTEEPNPNSELSQSQRHALRAYLKSITPEKAQEAAEDVKSSLKDVPWQTMILTGAKPLVNAALSMIARRQAKQVATAGLAQVVGSGLAVSGGAAAVAVAVDAIRLGKGGGAALYDSAAQNIVAGLTTFAGSERTARDGRESEKEYLKNKYDRKLTVPVKLLRKLGIVLNSGRNAAVQVAFGVTRDRSKISEKLQALTYDVTQSDDQLKARLLQALNNPDNSFQVSDLLSIGKRLARLRSMANYGANDVYGETGSNIHKVDSTYTPQELQRLHRLLNELVQDGQVSGLSPKNIENWSAEFLDVDRKLKDKTRKLAALLGTAANTFATVGMSYAIPMLYEASQKIDFDKIQPNPELLIQAIEKQLEGVGIENLNFDFTGYFDRVKDFLGQGLEKAKETLGFDENEASFGRSTKDKFLKNDKGTPIVESESQPSIKIDTLDQETIPQSTEEVPQAASQPPASTRNTDPLASSTQIVTDQDNANHIVSQATENLTRVPLAEDQIDIISLGEDQIPNDAILHTVQDIGGIENPLGTTNVIKNLYKALNFHLPVGVIQPDSGFAILPDNDIPTELPDGAVAYFFSEDQIEKLSGHIDEALTTWKNGGELTEMQENLVQLNGGRLSFEELAQDQELLREMLKLANEG